MTDHPESFQPDDASETPHPKLPSLLSELRASQRDLMKTALPILTVGLIGFLVAFLFIEPPPPGKIVIAAGPQGGMYHQTAREYGKRLAEYGIALVIRETAGSVENYETLLEDDVVQLAIVQGGTAPDDPAAEQRIETLAALFSEPLWVFCRRDETIDQLSELAGKRVAIGARGSGTHELAVRLLDANGAGTGDEPAMLFNVGGKDAIEKLRAGEVDAALIVLATESQLIRQLLADDQLQLIPFQRAPAYAMRFPFLHAVELRRGVVDFDRDLPRVDVPLVAPYAFLVATHDLHDAFVPLLAEAAAAVHRQSGMVFAAGEFPSLEDVEFPPNVAARHYLSHGPSWVQRHVSFWVSSLIDRAKIMIVPLIVLMIPLAKLAPPVYRWQIRSRIYRWYALLREIDQALLHGNADMQLMGRKLAAIESELEDVKVPLSFMEEFYHLRLHIDLVQRRFENRHGGSS